MKENKLTKKWIVAFILATLPFMYSCSNEYIEEKTETTTVSVQKASSIVKNQFEDFLEHSTESRSNAFDNVDWDFENIIEVHNESESSYVYMMADKENPDYILGGCSTTSDIISTFFMFRKNGDLYTLADEQGSPIVDVKVISETNEIILIKNYVTESRASAEAWCGLGMTVVGGAAAYIIPVTGVAGIGFAACWGLVSYLMCKDV